MLLSLSALFAVLDGLRYIDAPVSALRSTVKTLPVAILALQAGLSGAALPCLALCLSAFGDFALSRAGRRAFLGGLAGFALAHLAYLALFLPGAALPPWPAVVLLVGLAASTPVWLLPHAGGLRLAVAVYVLLIVAMGLAAWGRPELAVRAGATAFLLSDLLLALQLFRRVPHLSRLLWALYWVAQVLIAAGSGVFPGFDPA